MRREQHPLGAGVRAKTGGSTPGLISRVHRQALWIGFYRTGRPTPRSWRWWPSAIPWLHLLGSVKEFEARPFQPGGVSLRTERCREFVGDAKAADQIDSPRQGL